LIHRDIKPQNVVVTPTDFAYLVDFGIAEAKGDSHLTMAGYQLGSFDYMAPERFNDAESTPAVDVYSLACVLYEALTADTPFPGHSLEQVMAAHLSSPPPRPSAVNPRVPASFDDVIARGMAKEPDDRYGSAAALGRAARRALTKAGEQRLHNADTMAAGYSAPPVDYPQPDPKYGSPTTGPTVVPSDAQSRGGRDRWILPTVIATAAALMLGAIAVVIVLLARQTPGPTASPSPSTIYGAPTAPAYPTGSPQMPTLPPPAPSAPPQQPPARVPPPAPPPAPAAVPPLITGPDNSASPESCDYGYSLNNITGWASHAGRGTPDPSCYFAGSVLTSYWNEYGNPSRQLRTVSAPGAVNCNTVPDALCNGSNFLMQCMAYGSDNWLTCTGGEDARVYLY
jgi:serine/threonine-protein kinase